MIGWLRSRFVSRKQQRAELLVEELEPRILYSADAAVLLSPDALAPVAEVRSLDAYATAEDDPAFDPGTDTDVAPLDTPVIERTDAAVASSGDVVTASTETQPRREIVFIDSRVEDRDTLLADLAARDDAGTDVEIVLLDGTRDGLAQITAALDGRTDVSAVHVFSHGTDGQLRLGNGWIDESTLINRASELARWAGALTADADILLYACDVAADAQGESFVRQLAALTTADVAASTDTTGHASLGGDWNLEYATGAVEASVLPALATQDAWVDVLAVTSNGTVSSAQTTGATSLTWSHTVAAGSNRALFVELAIDGVGASVTSVTYGGVALTQVGRGAGNHAVEIWMLISPTVGTANVVATFGATTAAAGGASTFNGVNQTTPAGTFVSATGTGTAATVDVASAVGDIVIDVQYWDGAPSGGAPGGGQTLQWWQSVGTMIGGSTSEAGATTVTMSGTFTSSTQWELGAVSIKAALNSAPTITDGATVTLTAINENTTSSGTTVSAILASAGYADVDGGSSGIAITSKAGNGTWQYSTDGVTWAAFGTVSSTSALLLTSTTQVRYIPDGSNGGTATFGFRAWDQTSGTASTNGVASYATTASTGGTTAFSSGSATASMSVTSVNDAPVLADTALALQTNENAGAPSGTVGITVGSLAGGITDVDTSALAGIAITATDETHGAWYYTVDGGTNWTTVGTVGGGSSLLLASNAGTRLYFAPTASYSGTSAGALTFRAWDQTSGTAGSKVDTLANGGTTAFSAATDVVDVVVAPNVAPTADAGGPYTIGEGASLTLDGSASTDPESRPLTYAWDLDNDGNYGEAGEGTTSGPTIAWATLQSFGIDDDGTYTIGLRVSDGTLTHTATTTLTVTNTGPTLSVTGAASAIENHTYTLSLGATDPGADTITGWTIHWGDGTVDTVVGNPSSVSHTYALPGFTYAILASATDDDGTFTNSDALVSDLADHAVYRLDGTTGASLGTLTVNASLSQPMGSTFGPDGRLYVAGNASNTVVWYDLTAGTTGVFVSAGSGGLSSAGDVAFGADGNLYVASYGTDKVLRYDGTTGAFIDAFITGGVSGPGALAFGPDGDLYVGGWFDGKVWRFDGTTGALVGGSAFVTLAGGFGVGAIAFGPDGNLYVGDGNFSDLMKYDGTTGAFIAKLDDAISPRDITIGPDGNLYVADFVTGHVERYDVATGLSLGNFDTGVTGMSQAWGLAFVPDVQVTVVANVAPTITNLAGDALAYTEDDGAVVIEQGGDALVADVDTADFDTATLTVSFTAGSDSAEDVLGIRHQGTGAGQIGVSGADITYGGGVVGTFTGGSGGTPLVVTFGSAADAAAVGAVVNNVTYTNTDAVAPTTGARTVRFVLTDGDGGTSAASDTSVTVARLNDAPVLVDGSTVVLTGTNENTTSAGTPVSSLILPSIRSDVDDDGQRGIAVTGLSGRGTWQYSIDGSTWTTFGTVSTTHALLLTSTTQVRYVPDGVTTETATFDYRAWDRTTGTASTATVPGYADVGTSGGSTAYSTGAATASMTVAAVDDAPTFSAASGVVTTDLTTRDHGYAVTVQPDGKLLVAGTGRNAAFDMDFSLTRYNSDGSLDTTFGGTGNVLTDFGADSDDARSVVVQPDGKILVGGTATIGGRSVFALARYDADGSLDVTFNGTGMVTTSVVGGVNCNATSLVVQDGGKIVLAGTSGNGSTDIALVRYNANGSLDATFNGTGKVSIDLGTSYDTGLALALQADGRLLVAGNSNLSGSTHIAVVRIDDDGTLDTGFGTAGKVTLAMGSDSSATAIAVQADGRIVVGGYARGAVYYDFALARLQADGSLDTTFNGTGKVTTAVSATADQLHALIVQDDGKIVVAGTTDVSGDYDFAVVRYAADGSLDTTFNGTGIVSTDVGQATDTAYALVQQPDGKLVAVGDSIAFGFGPQPSVIGLVRYTTTGALDTQFGAAATTLDATPTYVENGAAVVLDAGAAVFDTELSAADNFAGATLTLARTGAANADDAFSATGTLSALTEGDPLVVGGTTIGTVTTNSGGTLLLTFDAGATGALVNAAMRQIAYANGSDAPPASAQIDWTFDDGNTGSQGSGGALTATGSTTVTITAVNDAPTTTAVTLTAITEDSGARVITQAELLANAADVDGPALTATDLAIATGAGTLVDNLDGTWTYTPDAGDDTSVSFDYSITDGTASAAGSASLDITPVNDAPTTTAVTLASIGEDSGARVITQAELLGNAADVDGPSLTATGLAIATGGGHLVDNLDGTWTYTPDADDDTAVTFDYAITDGTASVAGAASLDITPVNDAPTTTSVTLTAITEDSGPRVITQAELLANAADVDGPALTATGLAIATGGGTLVDNLDGTWSYTPDADDDTSVTFDYSISDGTASVAGSASLDITPANDAPTTTAVTLASIGEDSGARVITQAELLANASDVDGPALTATGLAIATGGGNLVDNLDGTWTFTPDAGDDTAVTFDYSITDGTASVAGSASLDITPTNDAPVLDSAGLTVSEDQTVTLSAADFGITDPDSTTFTFTPSSVGGGIFQLASARGVSIASFTSAQLAGGLVEFVDDGNEVAPSFSLTVNDGTSNSNTLAATIVYSATNDAPTTTPVVLTAIAENSGPRVITQAELLANAADVDGPALTATGLAIATGAGNLVDNLDGTWTYTPDAGDDTAVAFGYTITDGTGSVAGTASLDITPAPVVATTAPPPVYPGWAAPTATAAPATMSTGTPESPNVTETPDTPARPAVESTSTTDADTDDMPAAPRTADRSASRTSDIGVGASTGGPVGGPDDGIGPDIEDALMLDRLLADAAVVAAANAGPDATMRYAAIGVPAANAQTVAQLRLLLASFGMEVSDTLAAPAPTGVIRVATAAAPATERPADTTPQLDLNAAGAVRLTGVAMSAGVVLWALRGGGLLVSLIGAVPAWRNLDPLPVLAPEEDKPEWMVRDDEEAEPRDPVSTRLREAARIASAAAEFVL